MQRHKQYLRRIVKYIASCLLIGLACIAASSPPKDRDRPHRLALLISASLPGGDAAETAMSNDQKAVTAALHSRGFDDGEILAVNGHLDRAMVVNLARTAARRIAQWDNGDVLVYYSGHGSYTMDIHKRAVPVMQFVPEDTAGGLPPDGSLSYHQLFAELNAPSGVRLILLPDG